MGSRRFRALWVAALVVAGSAAPYRVAGATTAPQVRVNQLVAIESRGGSVPARVPITLDAPSSTPVTLHYATASLPGDQAVPHTDYAPTSGSLTFAPGQVQKTVKVAILPDHVQDPGKSFHLGIDNVVGAVIGRSSGVVIINDTYPAGGLIGSVVEFDAEAVGRGKTYVATVTFALIDKFDHAVTAHFSTVPETALPGVDYVAQAGSIAIPAGELSVTVSVKLLRRAANVRRVFTVGLFPIVGLPNGQDSANALVSLLPPPLPPSP